MSSTQRNIVAGQGRGRLHRVVAGLAAVATVLSSGLFSQGMPQAQAADALVELTDDLIVNSPFATMGSNTSGLTVEAHYVINDNAGGAGALATIILEPEKADYTAQSGTKFFVGKHYFESCPAVTKTVDMGDDSCTIDADNGTITVTILFAGGVKGTRGSFTLVFPFDHTTFDGRVADGTALGNLDVSIVKDGGATSRRTQDVMSSAINATSIDIGSAGANAITKTMLLDNTGQALIYANLTGMIPVASYPQTTSWLLEPGSTVTVQLHYPGGTIISGITAGGIDDHNGTITWTSAKVADNGSLAGTEYVFNVNPPKYRVNGKWVTVQFPSVTFKNGDQEALTVTSDFTLWGNIPKQVTSAWGINLRAAGTTPHLSSFTTALSGASNNVFVSIDQPNVASSVNDYTGRSGYNITNGQYNNTYSDIPDVVFTWQNSSDHRKARLAGINLGVAGSAMKAELKLYVYEANGTPATPSTITKYVNMNNSSGIDATNLYDATAGQYVDHFELRPLNNPNDSLDDLMAGTVTPVYTYQAATLDLSIYLSFMSWPTGEFPDGAPIVAGDVSHFSASLTWHDEVTPSAFTGATVVTSGASNTVTLNLPEEPDTNPYQKVLYLNNPVVMNAYITTIDGGTKKIGDKFGATLQLQTALGGTYPIADAWVDPVVYVMPPAVIDLDTSLPIHFYSPGGADLGEVTVQGPLNIAGYNGVYKLSLPTGTTIARSVNNFLDIKLTYVVKDNAPVGTYSLAGTGELSGGTYPATVGRIVPSSTQPFDLPIAPWNMVKYPGSQVTAVNGVYAGGSYFAADPNNIDSNIPYTSTSADLAQLHDSPLSVFQVVKSNNMDPSAELRTNGTNPDDPSDDVWVNLTDPAAEQGATIPLTKTGQFSLTLQNKGNTYVGDVRLLDILPYVGDTRVYIPNPSDNSMERGSQWQASLEGLTVIVRDADGNDVTSQFPYALNLSTQENPSYSATGMTRTGDGAFTADTTDVSAARSFEFILADRLPPGYVVELVGTVKAPANATAAQINESAYNSFVATGNFYDSATGGDPTQAAGPLEPENQRLRLADGPIASFDDVVGAVYKDLNGNDVYDQDIDQPYAGVTVELVKPDPDNSGSYIPVLGADGITPRTTTTDESGRFSFDELYSGSYVFHVVMPDALVQAGSYFFDEPGDDLSVPTVLASAVPDAVDYSMVDADGYTPAVTIAPGAHVNGEVNAGIKAATTLTVQFEDEATHTVLSDYTVGPTSGTYHGDSASGYGHQDVTVTSDATRSGSGYTVPADYHIVGDASQTAVFAWDDLSQTVTFEVAKDTYKLIFDLNGATGTAPDDQVLPWGGTATSVADPTWADHTFLGWETADGTVWVFGSGGTPMPQNDVTLYAQWAEVPALDTYTLSFDLNGATGTAPDDQVLPWGSTATSVADPTWADHTFLGWETADGTVWGFGSDGTPMPQNDVTLYAQWAGVPALSLAAAQTVLDDQLQTGEAVTFTHTLTTDPGAAVTGCTVNIAKPDDYGEAKAEYSISGDQVTVTFNAPDADAHSIAQYQISVVCTDTVEDPIEQTTNTVTDIVNVVYPSITLDLTAKPSWGDDASGAVNDTVTWQYTITNNGTADLTNITLSQTTTPSGLSGLTCVDENNATVDIAGGNVRLAGGKVITCTATSKVTQDDIDNAGTVNAATVSGVDASDTTQEVTDSLSVPLDQNAVATVVKTFSLTTDANGNGLAELGDQLTFQITVTNDGNVTLRNVKVTDSMEQLTLNCGDQTNGAITVDPGKAVVCTTDAYTITADDAAAGKVVNTATASGQFGPQTRTPGGPGGDMPSKSTEVTVTVTPTQAPTEVTVTVTPTQAPTGGWVANTNWAWAWLFGAGLLLAGSCLLIRRRQHQAGEAV